MRAKHTHQAPLSAMLLNTISDYWDKYPLRFIDQLVWKRAEIIIKKSEILRFLKPQGTYLAVGTGSGHVDATLRNKGVAVVSSDPFIQPFNTTRNGQLIQARAQDISQANGSFDGVLAVFMMHHIPSVDWPLIFDHFERIVKPHGRLILIEDVPEIYGDISLRLWDHWTNGEIVDMLKVIIGTRNKDAVETVTAETIMEHLASGKLNDLHLADAMWKHIFSVRGWRLTHEKGFTSHSPLTKTVITHKLYVVEVGSKE
jgi:ubiquinone/menaquinone biosynthesis C-methylase UbiE